MSCEVRLHPAAQEELQNLDGRLRIMVAKQLIKLRDNPLAGKELGNRAGIDLTGYRKMYADNRRVRIVYSHQQNILMVFVVSIGKREDMAVYIEAFRRIGLAKGRFIVPDTIDASNELIAKMSAGEVV